MGKHKKHKKKTKKQKKDKKEYSSSSESEYEWVEAKSNEKEERRDSSSSDSEREEKRISSSSKKDINNKDLSSNFSDQRDEWMNLPTLFTSTSSKDRQEKREKERKEKTEAEKYCPSNSSRELNPYWKDGGDGLPKFAKPGYDSDNESKTYISRNRVRTESSWRKKKDDTEKHVRDPTRKDDKYYYKKERKREYSPEDERVSRKQSSDGSTRKDDVIAASSNQSDPIKNDILSEKELNLLAGKLVKAEIMGNTKLVEELKTKLENARKAVEQAKCDSTNEEVLLTHTDKQGRSQPVKFKSEHQESSSGKQKRIKTETHNNSNERVRYFADDDKYTLKQMFEEEKYSDSYRQERDFVDMAGKVKKNDDLDDLFTDEVRRTKSDSKIDASNKDKAIKEHQKTVKALDNCDRCIQSEHSLKHLMVSMGECAYLALPSREALTEGHCFIVPIRHVSCSTALDENEWAEIMDFRKALVKYFRTKNEEPIFFESAMYFHKQTHMVIECIPVSSEDNMAPIYFKKAIDESETEWAQNKKLVSLKGKDVRRAIPKGLPYFFVSFGLEEGYAHVIEDEKMFPKNFAQEIIGGMLDLHHNKWRNPKREPFNEQSKRVLKFSNEWKSFDCTSRT